MKRKLEANREQLFDVNMVICMSVTVTGKASRKQLEEAFSKSVSSYEVLNTHIVLEENGDAFYESYSSPLNNIYYTEKNLTELLNEQEKVRFHIENGEFLKLFVNDTHDGYFCLHFLMHHLAGDGKSLCYFIESYLNCLNGKEPEYSNMALSGRNSIPKDSLQFLLIKAYTAILNKKWKKESYVFDFSDFDNAYNRFWETHKTITEFTSTEKNEFDEILAQCHNNKVSFTSYFISEKRKNIPHRHRTGVAVSIREKNNKKMGNLVTGIAVKRRYIFKKNVWKNAFLINKEIKHNLLSPKTKYLALNFMMCLSPPLEDALIFQTNGLYSSKTTALINNAIHYSSNSKGANVQNITNLGIIDIPTDYGDYHISSFWFIPPLVSYGKTVTGLITVNGKLFVADRRYE